MRKLLCSTLMAIAIWSPVSRAEESKQISFTHPYLEQARAKGYMVDKIIKRPPYIAVKLKESSRGMMDRLLLFVEEENTSHLIKEWGGGKGENGEQLDWWRVSDFFFKDLTRDGELEFIFRNYNGGTAWLGNPMHIFLLSQNGVKEITPKVPEKWEVHRVVDADKDGKYELAVIVAEYEWYVGCHAAGPGCYRIYTWNDVAEAFVDASYRFPEYYKSQILIQMDYLRNGGFCDDDVGGYWEGDAIEVLLHYWCMDRLDEGWEVYNMLIGYLKTKVSKAKRKRIEDHRADLRNRLHVDKAIVRSETKERSRIFPLAVWKDIMPKLPLTYVVKEGDTLWDIAAKYYGNGEKWKAILAANPDLRPQALQIGTQLTIPRLIPDDEE